MDADRMGITWVRGVEVDYSGDRINNFYELQPPFDFVGMNKKLTRDDSSTILHAFVGGKDVFNRQNPPSTFSERMFDPRFTPFIDLLNAKLRPTSNTRTASVPRMYPLYRVLSGNGKLNVGAAISANLFRRTKEKTAPLCYPGLIHQLCRAAGVDMAQFEGANTKKINLGKAIPLPPPTETITLALFRPLTCFESDEGTHPADSVGPADRRSTSTSTKRARTSKKATPIIQLRTMPPIQEVITELEPSVPVGGAPVRTDTIQQSSGEPSVQPITATTSARPTVPLPTPAFQPAPSASREPELPSQTTSSTTHVTMDMLMEILRQKDEAEERKREDKRREKEEEKRRKREEKEKRQEEENRRREEEYRIREEQSRQRDEMMLKQLRESQLLMQMVVGYIQQGNLPPSSSGTTAPVTLALPTQPAGSTQTLAGTTESDQPSQSTQPTPAVEPSQDQP